MCFIAVTLAHQMCSVIGQYLMLRKVHIFDYCCSRVPMKIYCQQIYGTLVLTYTAE